ncbi:zinc finger, CCHC-type containing protein [Tanacetum coccineum]
MKPNELSQSLGYREAVRLPDLKLKTLDDRVVDCIFIGYAKQSKAFRFYVIEHNEFVSINSITKSRDAIFDENRFSSIPRPSQRSLINGTDNIGDLEVTGKVYEEVLIPKLERSKRARTSKFSMKDMGEADVILGIRIKHESNGISISQSYYIEKVLKKLNYFEYTPVSTPMDTNVGNLNRYPSVLEGYIDASWITNTKDDSSTSSWVFLLRGGVISWALKKQTCIASSTMKSEFVALAAAGKEAEWLKKPDL